MAKSCCVCNEKIGAFDRPKELIEGNDAYVLCARCGEKLPVAKEADIDPSRTNALAYHDKALDYFAAHLSDPGIDPVVADALMALPGIADRQREHAEQSAMQAEVNRRYREERDSVIATTGYEVSGHRISKYHGVVTADAIIGTGMVSEFKASVSDLVGETSNALGDKMASAKSQAYDQMLKDAIYAGGNAVIGVSYDVYVVGSMLGVSVTGTSVTIEGD